MTFTIGPNAVLGDRYRLRDRIAVGGQGEVWRAEDTALGRTVAVKILRGEFAGSAEFRDRFHREARHAARLSHPGIAQVFDYDEGHGGASSYLVMEYVPGESLSDTIARDAPLSPGRVLDVLAAVASALAAAHAAGLVHRDVKPGNLLVGEDGAIKITDFGIARAVDAVPLTRTGTLIGTPLYLAPEQASGRPATAASDLYALGVIAYEMLTGVPPYEGPAAAVLVAHRDAPFPDLPPSVPPAVRDLVRDLTAKDPALRPPGAAALVDRIVRLRADPVPGRHDTRLDEPLPDAPSTPGLPRGPRAPGGPIPPAGVPAGGWPAGGGPAGGGPASGGYADGGNAGGGYAGGGYAGGAAGRPGGATRVLDVPVPAAGRSRRRVPALILALGGLAVALVAGVVWLAASSGSGAPSAVAPTPSASPATSQPVHQVNRHTPPPHRKPVRHPAGHAPKPPHDKHKPHKPKGGHKGP